MTGKRSIENRLSDLEGGTPTPEYSEEDLSLTREEKQVLDGFFSVDEADMYSPTDSETIELFNEFN